MSSDSLISADYGALLTAVRERIRSAQYEALRAVNRQLVELYWDIGRLVVEQQRDESWGRSVAVLDDTVRLPDENPAIGIILCKSKDETVVEYALRESNKPIGVASYRVFRTLPKELKGQLPEPEQVA